jgi:deferrochelatase/peroxidase EfeB
VSEKVQPPGRAVAEFALALSRRRLFGLSALGTADSRRRAVGGAVERVTAAALPAPVPPCEAGPGLAEAGRFPSAVRVGRDGHGGAGPAPFVSFDVITASGDAAVAMLQTRTAAARRLMQGEPVGPEDTGKTLGLPPSRLTLTIGFGPTLFTADGPDRFQLAARRPEPLGELPTFPGNRVEPAISGGDLCIQACAKDPQVAVHAVRNIVRLGAGVVRVRWTELGSAGPPAPARLRRHHATSWTSRTAPRT